MTTYRPRNCRPARRPANCCYGDCNQGRDCPNASIKTGAKSLAVACTLVAACQIVGGLLAYFWTR